MQNMINYRNVKCKIIKLWKISQISEDNNRNNYKHIWKIFNILTKNQEKEYLSYKIKLRCLLVKEVEPNGKIETIVLKYQPKIIVMYKGENIAKVSDRKFNKDKIIHLLLKQELVQILLTWQITIKLQKKKCFFDFFIYNRFLTKQQNNNLYKQLILIQNIMEKEVKYLEYRKLDLKIKKSRIENAEQNKIATPNPQGKHQFSQLNFMKFLVAQDKKMIQLFTYRYKSQKQPKAIIIMFHGLNSHIGHGPHLAYQFSKHQIETVGFDYRGFGRSQGTTGHVDSFDEHLEDCTNFVKKIKQIYPKKPIFALGLSLGGATSYHLSLRDSKMFDGVILMAPALKNNIGGLLVKLTGFLSAILPDKTKLTKPIYGQASKNPQITQDIKADPYAFSGRARISTLSMLVKIMDKSPQTFKIYKCPFIIFQGGLDKLVNPQVAFQLYDNSLTPVKDKQIFFYENTWHDMWHQDEIQDIILKTIQWVHSRLK